MEHLWIIVHGVMLALLALSRSSCADIMQDFVVDEGTSPGTLIGRIDVSASHSQEEIPKPPYIIMSYQENVDRDLAINENTGEIRARIALDREVTDFYSFMAVPLMGGSNIRVKVAIRDINDHSPVFKDELVKIQFSESQPRDSRRSLPPATDSDVGINTTQRYEIVSGNINNVFRLSSRRGRDGILYLDLEINGVLDRETIEHYLLSVEAYDGGTPPRTGRLMVDITLEDDNDNTPLFGESRYYAAVMENATIGTIVLKVEATDADLGRNAQIQYSINRRQSDSEVFFEIDSSTGVITLNKVLDYEKKASYELVVTARDNGTQVLESSAFVYIDIINVNDQAPQIGVVFLNNGSGYIAEDVPVGHLVARLSVSDEEALVDSSKLMLNLTAAVDKFELMQESSTVYILRTKALLDYEEAKNYTVTLVASDGGQPPLTTEKTITIFVTDVNDNTPRFENSSYVIEASESVDNGTVLLHVLATDRDEDVNAQLEYFLLNDKSGKLRVDPVSGVVSAALSWECEDEHMEEMVIGVRDKGVPTLTSTAVLRLSFRSDSDVVPVFEKPFYNVTLQAEDVEVGNCFLKVRADGSGCSGSSSGKIHYALDAAPAWSDEHFRIDAKTGQLCIAKSLEESPGYPIRQMLLRATDIHRNSSTTAFLQIYLPPGVFYKSRYGRRDKYSAGVHNMAAIGTPVVQVKPAGEEEGMVLSEETQFGWRFVYSIASGNDQQLFQVEPISGLIRVAKPLEKHMGSHKLDVMVREASSKLLMGNIQVAITVDSQEPFFTNKVYKFVVAEDTPVGSTAGKVQVAPHLLGLGFVMQPTGSPDFEIDSVTGVIRTKKTLDREGRTVHAFNVVAHYQSKPGQDTAQVMVTVGDVDDHTPTFRQAEADLHVPESVVTGDAIFQAVALDRDTRHKRPIQYAITSPRQEQFHMDANSGLLIINKPLDYETSSIHNLTIAAIELGTATPKHATMKLRVHVIDRNDHSPVFENSLYEVAVKENVAVDSVLLKVRATDSDTGKSGRVTYQVDPSSSIAHIFGVYPDTGSVYLRHPLDRETQDMFTFHIHATDHGQPQFKSVTTVRLTVLDVNDNAPKFTNNSQFEFSVLENTVGRTVVGKVLALDADAGLNGKVTYRLTCNDTGFEIDSASGDISTRRSFDREDVSAYSCEVFASDGENESSATVSIKVVDINDNTPIIVLPLDDAVWVPEGEPEGTEVFRVLAKDADEGENGRLVYSLEKDEDSYAFTIHPSSGTVRSQVVLDHEKQALFRLMVVASDRGNPAKVAKKTISVNVVDINDNRPTFSTNVMTIEVNEGTPAGVEIGSVLATDADSGENGRVTYSIVRGNVFGAFEIGRTSGKIYTAREVDYELAPSYMLRIRAVDSSSIKPKSNLLVVNVIVLDANDSPPKFSSNLCLFSVKENIALDTTVWNFSASDADSGSFGQVQYEIAYQFPQSSFKIHPMTGALSVAEPIDYERHKNYTLIVTASDKDPDRLRRKMTSLKCQIVIEDENDNSPKFVSRNIVRITENVPAGFPVTQMMAFDEDSFMSGNVTYEITRGNDDGIFDLNALTGLISLNQPSSEMKAKSYSLTIVATDNGTPRLATMQALTIEVDSSSKQLTVFNQTLYEVSIKEDIALNTVVLSFVVPVNISSQVRFSIPDEFLYSQFALDQNNGDLRVSKPLDRETKNSYVMNIYAANKVSPSLYDFATIKVTVTDVNDNAPLFHESCHGLSIPENNEFGVVHKFVAVDRDEGENSRVSYRIHSGNEASKFSINGENGELSSKPLDREEQETYVLVVVAEDRGKPSKSSSCQMEIAVLDQNDNFPVFLKEGYQVHLSEESPVGTFVEQVQSVDKDIGENGRVSYSIGNDSRGLLHINEASGLITTAGIFDHEVLREYRVEVLATDNGITRSQSTKVILDIVVDDVNDSAPEFSQYRYHVQARDAIRHGQAITKVVAEDKDAGKNSNVLFSFEKPQDKFEIHPSTGVVTAKNDIVPQGSGQLFHMTVVVKDQGDNTPKSSTGLLDIMVGDAPASSASLHFSPPSYTASLIENSRVGTKVTTVKATRSDRNKAAIAYSIVNGNVGDIFHIDKTTGLISVRHNGDLDYEKYHRFNLTVLAESVDADRLQEHTSVLVYVIDENDNSPRFGQNKYAASVLEGNNKGAFVVQLFATDDDSGKNGELTFEIIDGNTDGAFVIDPPFSGIVKTNRQIDREIQDTFKLTVVAKDAGTPRRTGTCTLKVSIVDINDNDPVFPQYGPVKVSEGASVGTTVFTVKANDVDSNSEVSYAIVGADSKNFTINRLTGAITVAAPLDRERQAQHVLTIQASDKVHMAQTRLTINVADINDNNPVFSQAKYEVTVPELTPPGTPLLTLRASDEDDGANGKVKYTLPLPSVSGFTIDERTGVLSSTKTLMYDPAQPLTVLGVQVEDNGSPKLTSLAEVMIRITSLNRNAPLFTRTVYSVHLPENAPLGQKVLQVSAADPDATNGTPSVKYTLLGDSDNVFQIDDRTGSVVLIRNVDREKVATYSLKVVASDFGRPVRNTTAEVIVYIDDVNDSAPKFNETEYKTFVNEAVAKNTAVLQVKATDYDAGENGTISYSILTGNEAGKFKINSVTGIVEVVGELDYEATTEYKLMIQAADSGSVEKQSSVVEATIYVTDANDHAPSYSVSKYNERIVENAPAGTLIFTAQAYDRDEGVYGKLQYSIAGDEGASVFEIEPTSGKVFSKVPFDYEQKHSYNFVVTARDSGDRRADVQVTVNVDSEDEYPPVFAQKAYRFYVSPKAKKDEMVGQVMAHDQDAGPDSVVLYKFQNAPDMLYLNSTTGVITMKMDFQKENDSKNDGNGTVMESNVVTPEVSSLVIANSGREGSKSDAALVVVIFGEPEFDLTQSTQTQSHVIIGVTVGVVVLVVVLLLTAAFCVRKERRRKSGRRQAYATSDNGLQYSAFHGIDNSVHGGNHYHDPINGTLMHCSDASSSGRGSAEDDEVRTMYGARYCPSNAYKKGRRGTGFPSVMPDSGLPDVDEMGDYTLKVPLPPSAPGSHESIHRFDIEGGDEEQYKRPSDQERCSHSSSSASSANSRFARLQPQPRLGLGLSRDMSIQPPPHCEKFDYLLWYPEYYGQMAAVYAEIADFTHMPSERSSVTNSHVPGQDSSSSVYFSKTSSQTTLPSLPPHLQHRYGRAEFMERARQGDNSGFSNRH